MYLWKMKICVTKASIAKGVHFHAGGSVPLFDTFSINCKFLYETGRKYFLIMCSASFFFGLKKKALGNVHY